MSSPLRYLALGDSYTIGTGAGPREAFPSVLARKLAHSIGRLVDVRNPAVNGYTTDDLIRDELHHLETFQPERITLLIGVNDFVQGSTEARYRDNLARIHDAIAAVGLPPSAVVAVSIPDFSYTPMAASFGGAERVARGLRAFNAAALELTEARGWHFVDIFEVSRSRAGEPGWIADDDLHPGAPQYAAWADRVWTEVREDWVG